MRALWLALLLAGCAAPTGIRPSTLTVYGDAGESQWHRGRVEPRGGVSVEFEFTYEEDEK